MPGDLVQEAPHEDQVVHALLLLLLRGLAVQPHIELRPQRLSARGMAGIGKALRVPLKDRA